MSTGSVIICRGSTMSTSGSRSGRREATQRDGAVRLLVPARSRGRARDAGRGHREAGKKARPAGHAGVLGDRAARQGKHFLASYVRGLNRILATVRRFSPAVGNVSQVRLTSDSGQNSAEPSGAGCAKQHSQGGCARSAEGRTGELLDRVHLEAVDVVPPLNNRNNQFWFWNTKGESQEESFADFGLVWFLFLRTFFWLEKKKPSQTKIGERFFLRLALRVPRPPNLLGSRYRRRPAMALAGRPAPNPRPALC